MEKFKSALRFIFGNFGPLIVFYGSNRLFGLKVAIFASVVWAAADWTRKKLRGEKVTPFFKFASAITIIFGLIDLYLQQSVLFKYEASLSNFLMSVYFGVTLFQEKPLIQALAEAQGQVEKNDITPDVSAFLRVLTGVWTFYFLAKSALYAWVGYRYTIEEGLAIRAVVGNVSLYSLMAISVLGASPLKKLLTRLGLIPPQPTTTAG